MITKEKLIIHCIDNEKLNPLMTLKDEVVEAFLEFYSTNLIIYIKKHKISKFISFAINNNFKLNVVNKANKINLIHYCCIEKMSGFIQSLINKGVDANQQDYKGNTPLHYAASNSILSLEELLKNKVDLEIKNLKGETPLFKSLDFKLKGLNSSVLLKLINAGSNINAQDNNGDTILFRIISSGIHYNNKAYVVKHILDSGYNINIKNKYGHDILSQSRFNDKIIYDELNRKI